MEIAVKRVLILATDSAALYTALGLKQTVRATARVIRVRDEMRDQCLSALEICLKFFSRRRDRLVAIAGGIFLGQELLCRFC
jgi:hypothetical protein